MDVWKNKMNDLINKIKINPETLIKDSLKKIDEAGIGNLFVCDENDSLLGSLTDGDIRRRILQTGNLQEEIVHCFNRKPVYVMDGNYTQEEVKELMLKATIEAIPVINNDKKIVDVLFWKDIFQGEIYNFDKINIPVVIMAGGKGERLDPFTKILPKPLIPVGEKPIIEVIIDRFIKYGVKRFYVTLNYKGEMVKIYFDSIEKNYDLEFVYEDEFLGTAGSLKLLTHSIGETFIVSNCDIIVEANYSDLMKFHNKNKNVLTVVGAIMHHKIPYGIINFKKEGKISNVQEKPEFDFMINTGVYVLSREIIDLIPEGRSFDMTDLINEALRQKKSVGVYPVSQKSYMDVGQWEGYKKHLEILRDLTIDV